MRRQVRDLRLATIRRGTARIATVFVAAAMAAAQAQTPVHEVFAVEFATLNYAVGQLVAGGDRSQRLDIAMMIWPVRLSGGRTLIVDAGFYRQKFIDQWKPSRYSRPSEALSAGLGIGPGEVTDIVLSHIHWDHADGADLFPRARIWIQRDEYEHYIGDDGTPRARGIDPEVASMLARMRAAGRVELVNGDDQEMAPGVRVYTGGKHTFASQYVRVQTRSGAVVLASDNACTSMSMWTYSLSVRRCSRSSWAHTAGVC